MPDDDRLAHLRAIPLFAELSEDALARVAELVSEVECPTGMMLARAEDPGSGMFVIEDGTVVIEARGRTMELGPGEFFGELALLAPETPRVARVRASSPVRCLALSRADFMSLLEEEPSIALAMLPVLARRLADVMQTG